MVHAFGTYAGTYDDWSNSEDGLSYGGVRRHAAYRAVGVDGEHWVVEPEVAVAAVTDAQRDFGVEGYDTRWTIDGAEVHFSSPDLPGQQRVQRDAEGNYRLPLNEFPDVAEQVRGWKVDSLVGLDWPSSPEVDESWVPEAVDGLRSDLRSVPGAPGLNAPTRDPGVSR